MELFSLRFRESIISKSLKVFTRLVMLFCLLAMVAGCGSKKKSVGRDKPTTKRQATRTVDSDVVNNALKYKGVKYKYGGTTRSGMDCSGLIYTAHAEAGQSLPRTSSGLFQASKKINIDDVEPGDLLFFGTRKSSKRLNHVGLVTRVTPAEILFIHSTTSRGVIVSSLNEPYWLQAYLSAGRLR
jgi:cell wall-associated NlpC family hydrolase